MLGGRGRREAALARTNTGSLQLVYRPAAFWTHRRHSIIRGHSPRGGHRRRILSPRWYSLAASRSAFRWWSRRRHSWLWRIPLHPRMAKRIHSAGKGHRRSDGAGPRTQTLGGGPAGERGALAIDI